ncbi:hypothetical protein HC031_03985 [Planosporangium thailandense]|uniref:Uncharacterized protein n=1 Tax=Planosporangium thailandense TaxID=765197 RepID=A0ABX0XUB4_9ACTN|nr:hypothetical protein [Planosporangium thailandense]NJC68889.1 hypothetical protein [Planosporangium thailandense]
MNPATGPPAGQPWPAYPAPTGRGRPPLPVSAATVLLMTAAVLALLPLVSLGYDFTHFDDVLRRAAERTAASAQEVSQEQTAHRIVAGATTAFVLLTSGALFVPALWLRRGNPVARVLSCIGGVGASVCCCGGYGLALAGAGMSSGTALQVEMAQLSARETPAWVGLVALPALLLAPLAITAVVLLLVPPSNRFFRPPPVPPPQQSNAGYYVYPAQWWGGPAEGAHPDTHPGDHPGPHAGSHPGPHPGDRPVGPPDDRPDPLDPRDHPPG